jgi:hypothetical protein
VIPFTAALAAAAVEAPGSEATRPRILKSPRLVIVLAYPSIPDFSTPPLHSSVDLFPALRPRTFDRFLVHKLRMLKVIVFNVTTANAPAGMLRFPSNLRWHLLKKFN